MNNRLSRSAVAIPLQQVFLTDGYWADRQTINRDKTIPAIYQQLEKTGRLDGWLLKPNQISPHGKNKVRRMFWDSDTGKRQVLDILIRYADLIGSLFGPNEGQKRGYPGHPELELALVKLYLWAKATRARFASGYVKVKEVSIGKGWFP